MEKRSGRKFRLDVLIYLGAGVLFVWLLYSVTMNELSRNPERIATAYLGDTGLVSLSFNTEPYPPVSGHPVVLSFMPMNRNNRPVPVNEVSYAYGLSGSDVPAGSGVAVLMTDGSGMYMQEVTFPEAGKWWLKVTLVKENSSAVMQFAVDVKSRP